MKSFKVSDGRVLIDGVLYGTSPVSDVKVQGKMGTIHSIMIEGRGQFFPLSGQFNDGTTPIVDSTTEVLDEPIVKKKGKLNKTELVEKSGVAVDEKGKIVKRKKGAKK